MTAEKSLVSCTPSLQPEIGLRHKIPVIQKTINPPFHPGQRGSFEEGVWSQSPDGSFAPHPLASFLHIPDHAPLRSERILFRTVILQALYEAHHGDAEAADWLLTPSADLTEVCDHALIEAGWLHTISKRVLDGEVGLPPWKVWRYFWVRDYGKI